MMDFVKLFENVPEALVVITPDYRILAATNNYLQITMRRREDILGLHFLLEAFPDKDLSYEENPVRKSLDKVLDTKKVDYLDVLRYDLTKPDGSYEERYWEASHTPVLDAEGNIEYIIQLTSDVTEREKARQALHLSNEKFRFMAEAMPQLIFTTNAEGQVTYFNKRWEDYTGIELEQLLHSDLYELVYPEDVALLKSKWEHAMQTGNDMQVEMRIKDKAGVYRWHLCRAQPMKEKKGDITMWVGSSTDIHATRKMVQELLETNEQMALMADQVKHAFEKAESRRETLERLIMHAPALFCVLKGPEHRYELVNEKYQMLFPKHDLIGKTVAEALPEVVEQGVIELLDSVYSSGKEFIAEEVPIKLDRHGDGELEEIYLTFIYQPMYEGNVIDGILMFAYEVTDQVTFKSKLKELGQI